MKVNKVILRGRYVAVDIGSLTTKLLYVDIGKATVEILDSYVVLDTAQYISGGDITNMWQLVNSIKKGIDCMGVKDTRIILASSVLGMQSKIQEYVAHTPAEVDQLFQNDPEDGKRYPTNITVRDYQFFGELVTENEVRMSTVITTAKLDVVKAICLTFKEFGYQICSIESIHSCVFSLMAMEKFTFDNPSAVYIDFGGSTNIYIMVEGTPRLLEQPDVKLAPMIGMMASDLGINLDTAMKLIRQVGLIECEDAYRIILGMGIREPIRYYDAITEQLTEFFKILENKLSKILSDFMLPTDCVYLMGGMAGIPGLESVLTFPVANVMMDLEISSQRLVVRNQTGHILSGSFLPMLGMLCHSESVHFINLVPQDKFMRVIDEALIKSLKYSILLLMVGCCILVYSIVHRGFMKYQLDNMQIQVSELNRDYSILNRKSQQLGDWIAAAESANGYMAQLVEFVSSYSASVIAIASIDSEDMLPPAAGADDAASNGTDGTGVPQSTNPGNSGGSDGQTTGNATGKVTGSAPSSRTPESSAESNDAPADSQETSITEMLDTQQQNIVLRGYSSSTSAISQLYTDLKKFEFVASAEVRGISQKTLQTLEQVYIFEIYVVLR